MHTPAIFIRFEAFSGRLGRCLLAIALLATAACSAGPPVQEMSDARQAISVAREAGASEHAPADLRAAEDLLDDALRNLSRKEYSEARVNAVEAKNKALVALAATETLRESETRL